MDTQKQVLAGIAKAIKAIDENSFYNISLEDKEKIQSARAKLINVIFKNGYELQEHTSRLIKSKSKRALLNDDAEGNTISIVWGIDDVMERAKQDEKEITEDQARKVLKMMKDNHDCNYGITWETISAYIDQI